MSARYRRVRNRARSRRAIIVAQVLSVVLGSALLMTASAAALGVATVSKWLQDLPDPNSPGAFDVAQPTTIYSADGKLLARLYLENREIVPLSKISTDLVNAVVAIEDERFYEHKGVDPFGIARAMVTNLEGGDLTGQGASTITQQYVRNTILLDERTDITLARKIREAYLAMELEKRYTKKQILAMYLNAIYFGEGAYGAQAASRTFFAKPASELTLAEAALIAGLPQQPGRLDPYDYPERALARRHMVLSRMLANGYITKDQFEEADKVRLALKRTKAPEDGIYSAHYFVAHVKKVLQARFTPGVVFEGGLTVRTTLDTRLQGYAERAVKHGIPSSGPEGALVSIDPRNGYVVALVGGRDYSKNKFNLATQGRRHAGSSFKTFTLVTALDEGVPPYTMIDASSPAYIPTKPKPWAVSNSEGSGKGAMSLEAATRASVNTVFARLAWAIGAKRIVATAKAMGIRSNLEPYPSITLGAQGVSPLEMASAYGTLATGGVHYDPVFVTKVYDRRGKLILEADPDAERAVRPSVAWAATKILKGVITGGTGRRAYIGRPAAGKTGTSQNYRDVWFVGYTPDLVTSVWVGYRQERTLYIHGRHAFGGTVCAPIWAEYMENALRGKPVLQFKTAATPKWSPGKFKIPRGEPPTEAVPPKTPTITPRPTPKPRPTPNPTPNPTEPPPPPPPSDPTTP